MLRAEDLIAEITFTTSRSSGPGGQHVNKVDSRVSLRFSVLKSDILTENQKSVLMKKWASSLTKTGDLILSSQTARSQAKNKEDVLKRFDDLLQEALKPVKKRMKTKPSKRAVEKRLKGKKELKEKKERRRGVN